MASMSTNISETREAVRTHIDPPHITHRSGQSILPSTYEAICFDGEDPKLAEIQECNNSALKRKFITASGASKRKRNDWETSIGYEDNLHRAIEVRSGQHARAISGTTSMDTSAYTMSETARVKTEYVIAEQELRRERAQHGKASEMTIATLLNAGQSMRRLLDQKIEAVNMYWKQEVDDLITIERAVLSSQESRTLCSSTCRKS